MKLFSYVVDHDTGYAPNPYFGVCTLCGCKFEGRRRRNIVQLAKEGDWVVGTGGASTKSAGRGTLVYAMRVDRKLTRWKYFTDGGFEQKKPAATGTYKQTRGDNQDPRKDGKNSFWREAHRLSDRKDKQFVLVSQHFYYFGAKAIPIPEEFKREKPGGFKLEKKGRGFRSHFDQEDIRWFVEWLEKKGTPGKHGEPFYQELPKRNKRCKSSC
jgi:Nucleotide modification associated domain 2